MSHITVEVPDELAESLAALPPEEVNRKAVEAFTQLVERRPKRTKMPPPGFAAAVRLERESRGDFRDGGQLFKDAERAEWREREARLGIPPVEGD